MNLPHIIAHYEYRHIGHAVVLCLVAFGHVWSMK